MTQSKSAGSKFLSWLKEIAIVIIGALVIAVLLRTFVGQMFIIPTGSMEQTLVPEDRVYVTKIGNFHRGDIVVFEDPGGWMPPPDSERGVFGKVFEFMGLLPNTATNHLIKRVIGMPGDQVTCCDAEGQITVNGQPLEESEYLFTDPNGVMVAPANIPFDVIVPKDRIFVLGDHRNLSGDSRCHLNDEAEPAGAAAFIPIDKVVGPTIALVAPLNRSRTFSVPKAFEKIPESKDSPPDEPILKVVNPGC